MTHDIDNLFKGEEREKKLKELYIILTNENELNDKEFIYNQYNNSKIDKNSLEDFLNGDKKVKHNILCGILMNEVTEFSTKGLRNFIHDLDKVTEVMKRKNIF